MRSAIDAAVRVGAQYGYDTDRPVLVHETNNTVVWLAPHAVIAKVGTRANSAERLSRERAVAAVLAAEGAPIAPPIENAAPTFDAATERLVTLWHRLDHDGRVVNDREAARALRLLHEHLLSYEGPLPDFRETLDGARLTLADDDLMSLLPSEDRSMLRTVFDRYRSDLDACDYPERTLHGEPHSGNLLATTHGPRWIDLERVCLGPLEWDLAFMRQEAASSFPEVNQDLLTLLRVLTSATVAAWCWSRSGYPEMRRHAELHTANVRRAAGWRGSLSPSVRAGARGWWERKRGRAG